MKTKTVLHQVHRLTQVSPSLWLLSVLGAIITSILWFLTLLATSLMMKYGIEAATEGGELYGLGALIITVIILLRLPVILGYALNSWASEKLSGRIQNDVIRSWIYRDLTKESNYSSGDIMTRVLNDCCDHLSEFYFQGFGLKVLEPLLTGGMAIIVLHWIDVRFLMIAVLGGLTSTLLTLRFTKKLSALQLRHQELNSTLNSSFVNHMRNMEVIKTLDMKAQAKQEFLQYAKEIKDTAIQIEQIEAFSTCIALTVDLLVLMACFLAGSQLSGFSFSTIAVIIQMQFFINNLLSNLGSMWNYLVKTSISAERVFSIIDELKQLNIAHESASSPVDVSTLRIQDISFSYEDTPVLKKVSLRAHKGELIAICGESGSGKTTLFQLLQGLRKNYEGSITLNGIDHAKFSSQELFSIIKLFEQQPALFHASIQENVQLACDHELTDNELKSCSIKLHLQEFLKNLPLEFSTIVEENSSNFSGGEQQKIALMRLFFLQAPVILLDEPTSAMDVESERIFCEFLKEYKKDKIILISTHRTKLLETADHIYTLDEGYLTCIL